MLGTLTCRTLIAPLVFLGMPLPAGAAEPARVIHVSPRGDDAADGTPQQPLATPAAAQQRVRQYLAERPGGDVQVLLHDGVYRLVEPLKFTPADAAEGHTVTWAAAPGAQPRISGGRPITGWEQQPDGSIAATIDEVAGGEWYFRELFVNGQRRPRARHPNTGFHRIRQAGEDRRTNFTFHEGELPEALAGDLTDSGLELVFFHDWSSTRVPVKSIDRQQSRLHAQYQVGSSLAFFHMVHWEPHPRYWLENHPALLDDPGEWHLDRESGKLIYLPMDGESIDDLEVIAPVAPGLIEVRGEPDRPVQGLVFRGLHFEHAAWDLPPQGYAGIQATAHNRRDGSEQTDLWNFVPAAIHFELAQDCALEHNSVRHLGRSAIWFGSRTSNNRIAGNLIDDVAGNGILIGEDLQRRVGGQRWTEAAPEQAATGNAITDNVIQHCGVKFFGAVGIWVGMAADTEIRHNLIRHLPYTGVSVGWMWNPRPTPCRGTIVQGNHIHHVMQVLSDGGGIYTLGLQPGAALVGNLIHDVPVNLGRAESNGMFLDEGTTEMIIEENVIYNTDRSPLRFHRAEKNLVRNNVLVVPDETPLIRYNATPQENIELKDNRVVPADRFDPDSITAVRERVGPRVEHEDLVEPESFIAR